MSINLIKKITRYENKWEEFVTAKLTSIMITKKYKTLITASNFISIINVGYYYKTIILTIYH